MILECDIGNTHTHWRLKGQGEGQFASPLWWQPETLPNDFTQLRVAHIKACSVNADALNAQVAQVAASLWRLVPQWAQVTAHAQGLHNGYQQPAQLGVDRWLALLAAWQRTQNACLVIDAGTALTLDLISSEGQHLGGYILPGRRAWLSVFQQHTQGVRPAESTAPAQLFAGQTTTACVLAAQQAALMGCLTTALNQLPPHAAVYVCGGDADWLQRLWINPPQNCYKVPHLVLDGLSLCTFTPSTF